MGSRFRGATYRAEHAEDLTKRNLRGFFLLFLHRQDRVAYQR